LSFPSLLFLLIIARSFLLKLRGRKSIYWKIKNSNLIQIYLPYVPNIVAFTVDKILSCVPIVGIRSLT
jgi:hypothetical protein